MTSNYFKHNFIRPKITERALDGRANELQEVVLCAWQGLEFF